MRKKCALFSFGFLLVASVTPLGALSFHTITPCRVLDTRTGSGQPLQSGFIDAANIAGFCGVPSTAIAVSANLTVTSPTGAGLVKVWPGGTPEPPATNLNFGPGATRANNAVLGLATDGFGDVAINPILDNNGQVHLIIDVNGYFQ